MVDEHPALSTGSSLSMRLLTRSEAHLLVLAHDGGPFPEERDCRHGS